MIGLHQNIVRLSPYDDEWLTRYQALSKEIKSSTLNEIVKGVEHVGSTSVPGLAAKPIIDIAVAVEDLSHSDDVRACLSDMGYINKGYFTANEGYLFVKEKEPEVSTVHLHLVEFKGRAWNNYLIFRNALISDHHIRDEYLALKMQLAQKFRDCRAAYTTSKADFIRRIITLYGGECYTPVD